MFSWIISHYIYVLMFLIGLSILAGLAKPAIDLLVKLVCFIIKAGSSVFYNIKDEFTAKS